MSLPIEVKATKNKGRGVFSKKCFEAGEVIEECPVIVISPSQSRLLEKTILDNYMYEWDSASSCLPLGYGLIYNHSYTPNARYTFDYPRHVMHYIAIRDIESGEEILVNYNYDPADTSPLDMQDVHYGGDLIVKE